MIVQAEQVRGVLCSRCNEPFTGGHLVVYCLADSVSITLHRACAERLSLDLAGDAREAQMADGDGVWAGRVERAAAAARRRKEHAAVNQSSTNGNDK